MDTIQYNIPREEPIIGYKGFDKDLCCLEKQYAVGETFTETCVDICKSGIHFCPIPYDVDDYYSFKKNHRFAIVHAWGTVSFRDDKCCASHVDVVKEVTVNEMMHSFEERVRASGEIEMITGDVVRWSTTEKDIVVVERVSGNKYWFQNGELHRDDDQPAVEWATGTKLWYQHGELHRDNDQPAMEWANGNKEWYQHGEMHRDNDRPAVEWANGDKEWWQHGKRYRDNDCPVIVYANGINM